ncbi:phage tail tape measure protein [Guyparkeria sp. SB14A]|uniref:phage tail tape measure protein n=1 Tax=Guyparkeria sp. SB14A TaxID=2571147 RepID=UPI0010ABB34F|nr:phage tail tape measure protein [Guyparkeria sp. SB14A]TKA91812.1 phage tail tape measure protein [Guyparkeria sp. SB14A]
MSDAEASIVISMSGDLQRQARKYTQDMQRFSSRSSRYLGKLQGATAALGRSMEAMGGKYAAMATGGVAAYKSIQAVVDSGQTDKALIRVQQMAGATQEMAANLRKELHGMAEETGQSFDSLLGGFGNLVQAGMSWEEAMSSISAINPAMAVTGARAETLSSALTVAAKSFEFDLSNPEKVVEILDQMVVAGDAGKAELEDLSGIFSRVGVNAKTAGLSFEDTLGFIEQLSQDVENPERLTTLVDSTLRLFTNQKYLNRASKATGVSFYNAEGDRRAAFDVIEDISEQYQKLETDQQRSSFIENAFGAADLDTIRGLRILLAEGNIPAAREISSQIGDAAGDIEKRLPGAINNAVDQANRLKATLREAADGFAQPINDTLVKAAKYLLDEQKLSGGELMTGGVVAGIAGLAGMRYGGKGLQKLAGKMGGLGSGLAVGKALEETTGVQSVYVVNMPSGGMMGGGGPGGKPRPRRNLRLPSRRQMLLGGGAVTAAGGVGYAVGTNIYKGALSQDNAMGWEGGAKLGDAIGEGVARTLAFFGNEDAKRAVEINEREEKRMKGDLRIKIDQEGRAKVQSVSAENLDIDIDSGMTLAP